VFNKEYGENQVTLSSPRSERYAFIKRIAEELELERGGDET